MAWDWNYSTGCFINLLMWACSAYVCASRDNTLHGYNQTSGRVQGRFFGKQSRASGVKSLESISFSRRNDSVSGSISPASPRLRIRMLDEGIEVHTYVAVLCYMYVHTHSFTGLDNNQLSLEKLITMISGVRLHVLHRRNFSGTISLVSCEECGL